MMTDFMAQPKRRTNAYVADTRRALSLIRPFVPLFEAWNQRAAKASATALSRVASSEERAHQARLLADLLKEVDASYAEFEAAVAGEPSHSRIEDLRAAYLRLKTVLERWRAEDSTAA